MNKPGIPKDEEKRLKTLRSLNILDTSSEERFDRLTRMAKRMFNVPIAVVSLIDENRQWFKSCIGLNVRETPRDISFCGHAILGQEIFIIPDASKDERFADNPLVTDAPYIRFYAGCPLRFTDGSALGTLCIIDDKPKNLTEDDIEALKDLALTAERELSAIQLSTLDELTNIPNRRGFMMICEHSLTLSVRQNIPAALVYMDLNHFKEINDTFGHEAGDNVLTSFSDHISHLCRESDIFARIGGDEFTILFFNASKKSAEEIMQKLKNALDHAYVTDTCQYDISFSYGIVEFNPRKHDSIADLLKDADLLMYQDKKRIKKTNLINKRILNDT